MKTSNYQDLTDASKIQVMELDEATAVDTRFQALLPEAKWAQLPVRIRRRFSKHLAGNKLAVYRGRITIMRRNIVGYCLSQLLRVAGSPLPICNDVDVPSLVCVSEDTAGGGQIWTRIYGRVSGFPQIISSAKRFSGPTGLEEYIGFGISIALRSSVETDAIVFTSDAYLLKIMSMQLQLPDWLSPGKLRVEHLDLGSGEFKFSLSLKHRLFGELLYQAGLYHDQVEIDGGME
jgi:hypothetical protein